MQIDASIFKDYDVRGHYPAQVNAPVFEAIAKELVSHFQPKIIAIGRDVRTSSAELQQAMVKGFTESGVDVVDLGVITTDMINFAGGFYGYDLNVVITGSHAEGENGFKLCKKGALPVSGLSDLYQIRDSLVKRESFSISEKAGTVIQKDILDDWIKYALGFANLEQIKKFKIVVDTGNGTAGILLKKVEEKLSGEFINLFPEIDGNFPNHFPNPLIEKNVQQLKEAIIANKADFGITFDADGDRVFFVDEKQRFVGGTILTAMVSKSLLQKHPGEIIQYNAVCGRVVPETIQKYGGKPFRVRVGYSLIKDAMIKNNAIFTGEHSGHFFFRDNYFSDSGLIMALIVLELISQDGRALSQIVDDFAIYAHSGEINFVVKDKSAMMKLVETKYQKTANAIDWLDGVSIWFKEWWLNLRPSNTEPLLRLNVEADNAEMLKTKVAEIKEVLFSAGAVLK